MPVLCRSHPASCHPAAARYPVRACRGLGSAAAPAAIRPPRLFPSVIFVQTPVTCPDCLSSFKAVRALTIPASNALMTVSVSRSFVGFLHVLHRPDRTEREVEAVRRLAAERAAVVNIGQDRKRRTQVRLLPRFDVTVIIAPATVARRIHAGRRLSEQAHKRDIQSTGNLLPKIVSSNQTCR